MLAVAALPVLRPVWKAIMVQTAMIPPWVRIVVMKSFVRMPVFGFLGASDNKSFSAGSMPIAMAGSESVSRLINSRCTGANGTGRAARDVYNTERIPAMLPDSRNLMAFFMLRYTFRPLATALMMVAKLSSVSIMAAASLETSVPVMPIATPMSAFLRAGASLTPSPVMAVMEPRLCHASTMRILFSGETLA